MRPRTVEAWIWPLVYGGLLALCLGLFVARTDEDLAFWLYLVGTLATGAGVGLIVLRSRIKD